MTSPGPDAELEGQEDFLPPIQRLSSMEILDIAKAIVHGERAQTYGSAEESFERIGDYWTTWLGDKLKPAEGIDAYDVAMMMILMKVSRGHVAAHRDTAVDIAGYAALSERVATRAGRL